MNGRAASIAESSCLMNGLGFSTLMVGLLQLSVPSYALRLVRRFGTSRVGWFLVSAFSSLALLYLVVGLRPAGAGSGSAVTLNLIGAVASVLLLIGMGHLESLITHRQQAQMHEQKQRRAWEQRVQEQTAALAEMKHDLLVETGRRGHCEEALKDLERRYALLLEVCEARQGDAVRQVTGQVASQFSNALTIINGHIRLLLAKPQDPANSKHLGQLAVTAARGALLARQLLVAGGCYPLEREWLDLNRLLEELHPVFGTLVPRRIVLVTSGSMKLPPILADARLLKHIVTRFVVNACDGMPAGGVLGLRTEVVGGGIALGRNHRKPSGGEFVCLTISATGPGRGIRVPVEPSPTYSGGMDAGRSSLLGLASVYEAVRQLSGWVESAPKAGGRSEVKVFFPGAGRPGAQAQDV